MRENHHISLPDRKTMKKFCLCIGISLLMGNLALAGDIFPRNSDWFIIKGNSSLVQQTNDLLRLDARMSPHGVHVQTRDFNVDSLQHYRFEVQVRRIKGDMPFQLNLCWVDHGGMIISQEYNLMGKLVGNNWEPYVFEAVAPQEARYARVFINLPGGWGAEFKSFKLLEIKSTGLRVAADLYPAQAKKGDWPLILRIENRGDVVLDSAEVEIMLPKGVTSGDHLLFRIERLVYQDIFRKELDLSGMPEEPDSTIICTICGWAKGKPVQISSSTPVFITSAKETPVKTARLPVPVLPHTDIRLGCYYFPVMLDWDRHDWGVRRVDYLEPLLGYYDESLPQVADWHIYWAVTHGIRFFVFDWYWNQGMDFLNDALEKGFLQSRFKDEMKFCINWCSEGHCTQFKMDDLSTPSMLKFMKVLCERYFIHDNYLKVDGKPVVFLHTPTKLINTQGSWEGCKKVLEKMRSLAHSYGHRGVYFVAVMSNTPYLLDFQKGGFDATAPYAYGFRDVNKTEDEHGLLMLSYEATIPRHEECFSTAQEEAHARGLDYIPAAWVGWDYNPRTPQHYVRTPDNTPAAFRHMIEMLPEYVEPDHKLALIESWNEWGEGGEIEPGIQYRFGRLGAVRDMITKARGPYEVFIPAPEDVARFYTDITHDEIYDIYEKRYAARFNFSQGLTFDFEKGRQSLYLRPSGGNRDLRMESGVQKVYLVEAGAGLFSPPHLGIEASNVVGLEINMKAASGTEARIYWINDETPEWSVSCTKAFKLIADGQFHEYRIPLAGYPGWKGTVSQFRFHPSNQPGAIEIDYFKTY
jgi:hypothetical protein